MCRGKGKLRRRVAIVQKRLPGDGQTDAEALGKAQMAHDLGDQRIAVIGCAGVDVRGGNPAIETAGILDFDPVRVSVEPHGRVGALIGAVHHGVSCQLLQRGKRVVRLTDLARGAGDFSAHGDVDL